MVKRCSQSQSLAANLNQSSSCMKCRHILANKKQDEEIGAQEKYFCKDYKKLANEILLILALFLQIREEIAR